MRNYNCPLDLAKSALTDCRCEAPMLAQFCCRRHVVRAQTAAPTCLAAAVLAFATMPSFLSMSAWRVLLVAGCTALLVLDDWPCLWPTERRGRNRSQPLLPMHHHLRRRRHEVMMARRAARARGTLRLATDSAFTLAGSLRAGWRISRACALGRSRPPRHRRARPLKRPGARCTRAS